MKKTFQSKKDERKMEQQKIYTEYTKSLRNDTNTRERNCLSK